MKNKQEIRLRIINLLQDNESHLQSRQMGSQWHMIDKTAASSRTEILSWAIDLHEMDLLAQDMDEMVTERLSELRDHDQRAAQIKSKLLNRGSRILSEIIGGALVSIRQQISELEWLQGENQIFKNENKEPDKSEDH